MMESSGCSTELGDAKKCSCTSSIGSSGNNCQQTSNDKTIGQNDSPSDHPQPRPQGIPRRQTKSSNHNFGHTSGKTCSFWLWVLNRMDPTSVTLIAGMRTACLLILEWSIFGIGNPTSTAFQLGCLYTGLTDPHGNLTLRFQAMSMTLVAVVVVGTYLPALTYNIPAAYVPVAFGVAFTAGLVPLVSTSKVSPFAVISMKLATALFAINGAIFRKTNGYHDQEETGEDDASGSERSKLADSLVWAFIGGFLSLTFALSPEIIGTRDAIRTHLFQVYHGMGTMLQKRQQPNHWKDNNDDDKYHHYVFSMPTMPLPFVALRLTKTQDLVYHDITEDPRARQWLLNILQHADTIRAASLCLAKSHAIMRNYKNDDSLCGNDNDDSEEDDEINNNKRQSPPTTNQQQEQQHEQHQQQHAEDMMISFFRAVGYTCRGVALAFRFPWMMRFVPMCKRRVQYGPKLVQQAATRLKQQAQQQLPSVTITLVDLLQEELNVMVQIALNEDNNDMDNVNQQAWPPYSSWKTLPRRFADAFPSRSQVRLFVAILLSPRRVRQYLYEKDPSWATRGYALRFGTAFSVATVPELFVAGLQGTSAHWLPMTVALIMGPTQAATLDKVAHRTVGTLLGIGLGSALVPLFDYPPVLIALLGLTSYAAISLFQASYMGFTVFITAYAFCTTVGAGANVGVTIFFRCAWTLAAAFLVILVTYIYPPHTEYQVTQKLVDFARAIKAYAQATKKEHDLRRQLLLLAVQEQNSDTKPNSNNNSSESENKPAQVLGDEELGNQDTTMLLEQASDNVKQTRKAVIQARVALLSCLHEAVLTPTEPSVAIDPHSLAPALASDLIAAVVVPEMVSLMMQKANDNNEQSSSVSPLLSDFDETTYAEMDRLIERMEQHPLASRDTTSSLRRFSSITGPASTAVTTTTTTKGRNALSGAITAAHRRLDEADVPSLLFQAPE